MKTYVLFESGSDTGALAIITEKKTGHEFCKSLKTALSESFSIEQGQETIIIEYIDKDNRFTADISDNGERYKIKFYLAECLTY